MSLAKGTDGLQRDNQSNGVHLLQATGGGGISGTGAHQQTGERGICPSSAQGEKVNELYNITAEQNLMIELAI